MWRNQIAHYPQIIIFAGRLAFLNIVNRNFCNDLY